MIKKLCDICGKEVSWKSYISVCYPAVLSQYAFCGDCGSALVAFLYAHHLIDESKRLINF